MSKLLRGQIVGELPQTGEPGQLYFLRNTDDTYTQYVADDKGVLRKEKDAEGLTVDDVKGLITENQDVVKVTVGNTEDHYFGRVQDVTITNEKGEQTTFKNIVEPKLQIRHDGGAGTPVLELEFNDEHFTFDQDNGGIKIKDSVIKGAETATTLTQAGEKLVEGNGLAIDYRFVNEKGEEFPFSVLNKPFTYAKVGSDITEYTTEDELATIQFNQEQFAISEDKKTVQLNQSILNKLDKLTDEKIDKLLALLEKEEREANSTVGVWVEDEE